MATPRETQWVSGFFVGRRMKQMKLVEWPVVDSVPRRSLVDP